MAKAKKNLKKIAQTTSSIRQRMEEGLQHDIKETDEMGEPEEEEDKTELKGADPHIDDLYDPKFEIPYAKGKAKE